MTQRSANSDYCQDEVGLAEEYRKPILTVKLQQASEIDPGLKLVLFRRQIIDCSDGQFSEDNTAIFLEGIEGTIGPGTLQADESTKSSIAESNVEKSEEQVTSVETTDAVNESIEGNKESLTSLVRGILREDATLIKDTVKEVLQMERDSGVLREAVREVIAVEGSVGGRLREIIKEIVCEELQEQIRVELMRVSQK